MRFLLRKNLKFPGDYNLSHAYPDKNRAKISGLRAAKICEQPVS
jgi:hypothetical protein